MFTKWRMKHFKSIEQLDLSLSQINVFAGANSSGKSTILQSFLLLKQTVQYAPSARPLALNGPILKLGSFEDVHNAFCHHDHSIGLGFSLDIGKLPRSSSSRITAGSNRTFSVSANLRWVAPTANNADQTDDATAALSPILTEAEYDVYREVENSRKSRYFASIENKEYSTNNLYSHQVNALDDTSRKELLSGKPDAEIIGSSISHFFMSFVGIQYERTKQKSKRVAEAICGGGDLLYDAPNYAPFFLVTIIKEWLSSISDDDLTTYFDGLEPDYDNEVAISDVAEAFRYLRRSATASANPEIASKLIDTHSLSVSIEERLIDFWGPESTIDHALPRAIYEVNDRIKTYLTSFVRYLGPLRDEPRHVYPLEALSQPDDVGYRGEHTAAVLELNSGKFVEYVPARVFSLNPENWSAAVTRAPLRTAVIDWLTYVGVAVGFTAHDRGVFGHQLKVRTTDSNAFHDLTNVGVGVSQVLPIIVGSLLAPKGSCLIFEQPELHLHPKVQARLADFFLALGFGGKQCLLETHSEYLVDRLRLRIAQARGDDVAKKVCIFFTEKLEGVTTCTPVEISNYGAALKWPKDFFDQSQREVEAIIQAASAKRRAENSKSRSAPHDERGRD